MAGVRHTRVGVEVALELDPASRFTRIGVEVAVEPPGEPKARFTRIGVEIARAVATNSAVNVFGLFGRRNWLGGASQGVAKRYDGEAATPR